MNYRSLFIIAFLMVAATGAHCQHNEYSYSFGNTETTVDLQRHILSDKDPKSEEVSIDISIVEIFFYRVVTNP